MRQPAPKKTLEKINPLRREKISVNFPARGWHAALAIRYADASQESRLSDLNSDDMGVVRVAMMVVSEDELVDVLQ
jgi:hypothetical protein